MTTYITHYRHYVFFYLKPTDWEASPVYLPASRRVCTVHPSREHEGRTDYSLAQIDLLLLLPRGALLRHESLYLGGRGGSRARGGDRHKVQTKNQFFHYVGVGVDD